MKYDMPNFQTCGKSQKDVYTSKSPCLIYSDSSLIELEVLEVSEIPNKNVSGKHQESNINSYITYLSMIVIALTLQYSMTGKLMPKGQSFPI